MSRFWNLEVLSYLEMTVYVKLHVKTYRMCRRIQETDAQSSSYVIRNLEYVAEGLRIWSCFL